MGIQKWKSLIGGAVIFSAGAVFVSAAEEVVDALVIGDDKIRMNLPLQMKGVADGMQSINLYSDTHGMGVQHATTYFRSFSKFAWFEGGTHAPGELDPGEDGTLLMSLKSSGLNVPGGVTGKDGSGMVPKGAILMWSGNVDDIPEGWRLANGNDGKPVNGQAIPNLSGQFIVGYDPQKSDYNDIGNTGGAASVTLSYDNLPNHYHTLQGKKDFNAGPFAKSTFFTNSSTTGLVKSKDSKAKEAVENRPPFYTLAYIIYVGKG